MKAKSVSNAAILGFLFAGIMSAFSQTAIPIARFSATTANTSSPGDTVRIDILRWSTDTERDPLLAALEANGATALEGLLQRAPTVGYIWTTETAGYPLRYAYRIPMGDGGERIVLAIDRQLGSYEPERWKLSGAAARTDYPFTVVELRIGRTGMGEGKSSLNSTVIADKTDKTIALENYSAIPALLQGVRK